MTSFTESIVEEAALAWLGAIGWQIAHGPDIAPDMLAAERTDYGEMLRSRPPHGNFARKDPFRLGMYA